MRPRTCAVLVGPVWSAVLVASLAFGTPERGSQKEPMERDDCRAQHEGVPKYHVVRHYTTDLKRGLALFMDIATADVTREKLVALVCRVGTDHSQEQSLFVYIFDSKRAAKRFNPQGEGNDRQSNLEYRGLYWFSREPGKAYGQSLDWRPDRDDINSWVHIDLGPPPQKAH